VITGGDGNTTVRTAEIRNGEAINTRALTQYPVTVVPVPGGVAVMFVRGVPDLVKSRSQETRAEGHNVDAHLPLEFSPRHVGRFDLF